jgi:methanethiol S-methyltransferase
MKRYCALLYGGLTYLVFFGTLVYAVGFVVGVLVPKTINSGQGSSVPLALLIDAVLLAAFAVQHSGMARQAFKRWLTKGISPSIERSTYVLCSSLLMIVLFWQWRPLPQVVWNVSNATAAFALAVISLLGWGLAVVSTFLISHTDLFGLRQVVLYFRGEKYEYPAFRIPGLYKLVRHPLYSGFLVAFWVTPKMTAGHLLFAVATTGYIIVGTLLEERDLVRFLGPAYENYRREVPMFFPTGAKVRKSDKAKATGAS